jgi:hypothetical protein
MTVSLLVVVASELGRRISDRKLEREARIAREGPPA